MVAAALGRIHCRQRSLARPSYSADSLHKDAPKMTPVITEWDAPAPSPYSEPCRSISSYSGSRSAAALPIDKVCPFLFERWFRFPF